MNIKDVIKRKHAMEMEIGRAVRDFTLETKLKVDGLDLIVHEVHDECGEVHATTYRAEATVRV